MSSLPIIPIIFIVAFLVRLLFVPNPGFEADMSFWKSWGLAPFDHGLVWSLHNTNNNYPTPFAYLLLGVVKIYSLFRDPHNFYEFWNSGNLLFLTLMKLPAVLSDLGIGYLIIHIGKNAKKYFFPTLSKSFYILLASLYLFSPLSIIDGAWWGQVDSLGIIIFLSAIILTIRGKPFLAGLIFMLSMMTKLQNMIYGPIFFLFLFQMTGFAGLVRGLAGSILAFFGLNIEFLLARDMGRVITSLTVNYDYFPYLSLNAYNLWWIIAGGKGMDIIDKINILGILNAKTTGLYLFIGGYALALLTLFTSTWKTFKMKVKDVSMMDRAHTLMLFFTALIVANASFFLLQTESHERYAFPIAVFSLLLFPFVIQRVTTVKERSTWWITKIFQLYIGGYIFFTLLYFVNLHNALITFYPKNGISFLLFLKDPSITVGLSWILLTFFVVFLWFMRKTITFLPFLLSIILTIGLFIAANLPLLSKSPIPLTKFSPVKATQGYGRLNTNMPVNAGIESKTWNRLSVQYIFYEKGLGTHAASEITYDIGGKFRRFTTDVGIDTEAGSQGSVIFEVWGDGKKLWNSDLVKRFEYPRHADVDITKVKELTLIVTDGGNGITDDHADWLNPMLIP